MRAPAVDIWLGDGARNAREDPFAKHGGERLIGRIPLRWRRGVRGRLFREVCSHHPALKKITGLLGRTAWGGAPNALGLSLTDSGSFFAIAVAHGLPIGIDMERVRPVDGAQALVNLGLGGAAAQIAQIPPMRRVQAFLRIWTAFEAFLKLERSDWDEGARRFSQMARELRVSTDGGVTFGEPLSQRVFFVFPEADARLMICVAAAQRFTVRAKNALNS